VTQTRRDNGFPAPRAEIVALAALSALLSASTIWFGLAPHDEGLILQAAHRIASGELPYRDFWWNYAPGQPVLLAGLDVVFGRSLLVWRALRVLVDVAVTVLAFRLAQREAEGRRWPPLLAGVAVAGAMAFPTGPGPNPTALALAFGALVAAPRHPRAAGVLAGVAAIVRWEVGAAAALGVLISTRSARPVLVAVGVAVAGWLPFLVAAPGDLLDQTVGFFAIQDLQRLPFPFGPGDAGTDPNKLLERYAPLILVAGLALYAVHAIARRRLSPLVPLALVGLAYLLGRTDEFHLVPLAAVLPVLLAGAVAWEPLRLARVAFAVVLALIALHGVERKAGELRHVPDLAAVPGPAGDGVRTDAADARDLARLRAAVGDREIFVAPPRFSQVTVGDPLLYVILGRDNPTGYDVMQPGVVTKADAQREMVEDLERSRPEVLIRWLDPRTRPEPNGGGRERGATLLDAYLERTYLPAERFGPYALLERRTSASAPHGVHSATFAGRTQRSARRKIAAAMATTAAT
jgi:hypothetical protein